MTAFVSVSLFFLNFLCPWSLYLGVASAEKLLCLLCKTISKVNYLIIILSISLEKGECFQRKREGWFQSPFRVCLPYSTHHHTSRSSLSFELAYLCTFNCLIIGNSRKIFCNPGTYKPFCKFWIQTCDLLVGLVNNTTNISLLNIQGIWLFYNMDTPTIMAT